MTTLVLNVKDKLISNTEEFTCECRFVSCNTSYNIQFNFDDEWNGLNKKARIMYKSNSGHTLAKDLDLDDNDATCEIPYELIPDRGILYIGVYADNIAATNTVRFWIRGSAKTLGSTFNGNDQPGVVWHTHDNEKVLNLLNEKNTYLSYNGRQVVDERVIHLVETKDDLYNYSNDSATLAYVRTNRDTFTPIVLESGVVYGGPGVYKYRDPLYLDPLLVDFFPCEPFTVVTERVRIDSYKELYCQHEFSTDGSNWFSYTVSNDVGYTKTYLFNNTLSQITVKDTTYPFTGWNIYKDGVVHSYDPFTDDLIFLDLHLNSVKFSDERNFDDLQKILSTYAIYSAGIRGMYVIDNVEWKKFSFGDILLELQSTSDKAHTHTAQYDNNGKVSITLSSSSNGSGNGSGDLEFGGDIELN